MRGLLKNEVIKTRRQSGFKVLMILILVFALLLPIGEVFLELLFDRLIGGMTAKDQYDMYVQWASDLEDETAPDLRLDRQVYLADAEALRFFLDHELTEGWKSSMFQGDLMNDMEVLYIYRMLAEEQITIRDLQHSHYGWMVEEELSRSKKEESDEMEWIPPEESVKEEEPSVDLNAVDWKEEYARKSAELEQQMQYILDCTAKILLESEVEQYEKYLSVSNSAVEQYRAAVEMERERARSGDPQALIALEKADYTLAQAQASMRAYEEALWGVRFLYEHACAPDSWQYQTVYSVLIPAATTYYEESILMPQSIWSAQNSSGSDTYEDYLKEREKDTQVSSMRDAVIMAKYALEHDIPLPDMQESSVKEKIRSSFATVMGLITILTIVMMGMTVANEHASGTVRLLLIRPKRRSKVLTSKILCVLVYAFGTALVSGVILSITTVLLRGFGDLFVPDLVIRNSRVVALPCFVVTMERAGLLFLGLLFIAAIALFFSVVTKKAALAIVLPLILQTGFSLVQMLSLELIGYLPFLKFTVLPYLEPEALLVTPIQALTYSGYGAYYGQIASMSGAYGVLILLLHIGGIGALTYLIFNRQQIKS